MKRVLLGLGSNRCFDGNKPWILLARAAAHLSLFVKDMSFSSLYESKAMYVEDQENFFNMVIKGFVSDDIKPYDLLSKIHLIEAELGRDRTKEIRFGPRSIDIDIEEYENTVMDEEDLVLPHPRMLERGFVLIPALEIFSKVADEEVREKFEACKEKLPEQGVFKCSQEIQDAFQLEYEKFLKVVPLIQIAGGNAYGSNNSGNDRIDYSC